MQRKEDKTMITESKELKTKLVYDENRTKRYLLNIDWDLRLKKATVIMLSPSTTTGVFFDRTTNYVLENLCNLNYGSVDIVNLYAEFDLKGYKLEPDDENLKVIKKSIDKTDTIVYAVGTGHRTCKAVVNREQEMLELISKHSAKCFCISDSQGKSFYHPLCPKVKEWNLTPLPFKTILKELSVDD